MRKDQIIKKLKHYVDADQKLRNKLFGKTGTQNNATPQDLAKMDITDKTHLDFVKKIVKEYGLITISQFGTEASHHAWLLIQHATKDDLKFMEDYLALMEKNLDDINIKNYAYLKDRILMYKGLPQVYGTQMQINEKTGKAELYMVEDVEGLDDRRKSVGLGSVEDYVGLFG